MGSMSSVPEDLLLLIYNRSLIEHIRATRKIVELQVPQFIMSWIRPMMIITRLSALYNQNRMRPNDLIVLLFHCCLVGAGGNLPHRLFLAV